MRTYYTKNAQAFNLDAFELLMTMWMFLLVKE